MRLQHTFTTSWSAMNPVWSYHAQARWRMRVGGHLPHRGTVWWVGRYDRYTGWLLRWRHRYWVLVTAKDQERMIVVSVWKPQWWYDRLATLASDPHARDIHAAMTTLQDYVALAQ
ncbi:hypothetical protein [Sulfobacillus thermosulfidooxidans]|uniref:hypothetical protein n=1 Tax=Sulfobacillus thermosulfidooxidans TaxID=28034 RepID=UPI0006B5E595|nr:hypothetical protein [Sulfobacillus thermosulfidooxidans]